MIIRDKKGRIMKGSSNAWNKGIKWKNPKQSINMKGNKLNYKGGTTKRVALIRMMQEYLNWRSKVFERDNWTCQTCGNRGCYLEAHHRKELIKIVSEQNIKTVKDAKNCQELWDINNGVTLCKNCHNLTKYGRPNGN
jgi:hypothetical protein